MSTTMPMQYDQSLNLELDQGYVEMRPGEGPVVSSLGEVVLGHAQDPAIGDNETPETSAILSEEGLVGSARITEMAEQAVEIKIRLKERAQENPGKPKPRINRTSDDDSPVSDGHEDLVRTYLTQIGEHPLLTKEDEIDLARLIEFGVEAARITTGTNEGLNDEQEELRSQLVAIGAEARQKFIESNLRLVVSIAKKYQGSGLPLLDIVQEGNLGLFQAVEKFDWRRGFKFSTYATWWIRQSITRGIANTGRVIRLPVHESEQAARLSKALIRLETDLGRPPTVPEIAVDQDITEDKARDRLAWMPNTLSLDAEKGEEGDLDLYSFVADKTTDVAAEAERTLLSDALEAAMASLTTREAEVIRLRFGLDGGETRTLEEVGEVFGVTRERIRQIERRAVAKFLHPSMGKYDLRGFLD